MLKLKQSGFTALHLLLILVVVGVIGGTGYYVWQTNNKTEDTLETTENAQTDPEKTETNETEPAPDPTADWVSYKNPDGSFSFKHPKTWVTKKCEGGDDSVFLASTQDSLGTCNSDNGGMASISVVSGDYDFEPDSSYADTSIYKNYKKETITVNKLSATRREWLQGTTEGGFGDDLFHIRYEVDATGKTASSYFQASPGASNEASIFDTIVTKTLTF